MNGAASTGLAMARPDNNASTDTVPRNIEADIVSLPGFIFFLGEYGPRRPRSQADPTSAGWSAQALKPSREPVRGRAQASKFTHEFCYRTGVIGTCTRCSSTRATPGVFAAATR